ncbi:hypothetical protein CNECB9_1490003 [Cupriavidus necator]|uniref:Uncharacterized protein n=1 Tax=Cupriavidus necator TaxID=106590 RepID=A0A1K0IMH9_CUPNE|nr:hypothetical protein CNECB9_1490003 [Cupriavidus necator]
MRRVCRHRRHRPHRHQYPQWRQQPAGRRGACAHAGDGAAVPGAARGQRAAGDAGRDPVRGGLQHERGAPVRAHGPPRAARRRGHPADHLHPDRADRPGGGGQYRRDPGHAAVPAAHVGISGGGAPGCRGRRARTGRRRRRPARADAAGRAGLCDRRTVLLRCRGSLRARTGADPYRAARAADPPGPRALHGHDRTADAGGRDRDAAETRRGGGAGRSQRAGQGKAGARGRAGGAGGGQLCGFAGAGGAALQRAGRRRCRRGRRRALSYFFCRVLPAGLALVAYSTPCWARYSRISWRTTCDGVRSCEAHRVSKAFFLTGSIRMVRRAVLDSMRGVRRSRPVMAAAIGWALYTGQNSAEASGFLPSQAKALSGAAYRKSPSGTSRLPTTATGSGVQRRAGLGTRPASASPFLTSVPDIGMAPALLGHHHFHAPVRGTFAPLPARSSLTMAARSSDSAWLDGNRAPLIGWLWLWPMTCTLPSTLSIADATLSSAGISFVLTSAWPAPDMSSPRSWSQSPGSPAVPVPSSARGRSTLSRSSIFSGISASACNNRLAASYRGFRAQAISATRASMDLPAGSSAAMGSCLSRPVTACLAMESYAGGFGFGAGSSWFSHAVMLYLVLARDLARCLLRSFPRVNPISA